MNDTSIEIVQNIEPIEMGIGTINEYEPNLGYTIISKLSDLSMPIGSLMLIILSVAIIVLLINVLSNKNNIDSEKVRGNSKRLFTISLLSMIFVNVLNIIPMIFAMKSKKIVNQGETEKANKTNLIFTIVALIIGFIPLNIIILKVLNFVMWFKFVR